MIERKRKVRGLVVKNVFTLLSPFKVGELVCPPSLRLTFETINTYILFTSINPWRSSSFSEKSTLKLNKY